MARCLLLLLVAPVACTPAPEPDRIAEAVAPILTAERDGDFVTCSTRLPDSTTHYLIVERRGAEVRYGVYALGGAKNGIPIRRPFAGDPVTWPGVDHAGALVRLLVEAGLSPASARDAVERRAGTWFGPGLRVLFVPGEAVRDALGAATPGVLLVESDSPGRGAARWEDLP